MLKNYILILLTVIIGVIAQTFLKTGMNGLGKIENIEVSQMMPLAWRMGTNIFVIIGLSLYVIGTFFWLVLLSRLDLSFLYPFGALQYFFVFAVSYFILGEDIRPGRIVGVIVILFGIYIVTKFG